MHRCSVIGLGKLGACLAAGLATSDNSVVGVDSNPRVVEQIDAGRSPNVEPGLQELIAEAGSALRVTTDVADAVLRSDITFIVVPTPSDATGAFSLEHVRRAISAIGEALREKESYHNVVLTSTVLPGSLRFGIWPLLEETSGKTVGRDIGLCYNPQFIALGSVVRDLQSPDLVLIGESDEASGAHVEECCLSMVRGAVPRKRLSIENAELAKIALNTFVTTKITYANMLAELCENLPGGDVDAVTATVGLDKRVGRYGLTGGLGYGGPCFPRDNLAMAYLAKVLDCDTSLPVATQTANTAIPDRVVKRLASLVSAGTSVGVLGLAYKPSTPVVDESQGLILAQRLAEDGAVVRAYDPLVEPTSAPDVGRDVTLVDSVHECLSCDVVIVATPDPAFRALTLDDFRRHGTLAVVDCWRMLADRLPRDGRPEYVPVGRGSDTAGIDRLMGLWAPRDWAGAVSDELR